MDETGFLDFDIRIRPGSGGRHRIVLHPANQPEIELEDCDLSALMAAWPPSASPQADRGPGRYSPSGDAVVDEGPPDTASIRARGDQLYRTLFARLSGAGFDFYLRDLASRDTRVRYRFDLSETPALSAIPWEALYRQDNDELLATRKLTTIQRVIRSDGINPRLKPVTRPVRMLIAIANPRRDLDVEAEVADIEGRVAALQAQAEREPFLQIDVLRQATRSGLEDRVKLGEPSILHYIGHGGVEQGRGCIYLHDEDDPAQSDPVDAGELANALANDLPSLVVLNSCLGAVGSGQDLFSGVAQSLIRRGAPQVVAMQYAISDKAAIRFAESFYGELVKGEPVDVAVNEARNAIFALKTDAAKVEVITPVLYTALDADGGPFAPLPPAPPPLPPPVPTVPVPGGRSRAPILAMGLSGLAALVLAAGVFLFWMAPRTLTRPTSMSGAVDTSLDLNPPPQSRPPMTRPPKARPSASRPPPSRRPSSYNYGPGYPIPDPAPPPLPPLPPDYVDYYSQEAANFAQRQAEYRRLIEAYQLAQQDYQVRLADQTEKYQRARAAWEAAVAACKAGDTARCGDAAFGPPPPPPPPTLPPPPQPPQYEAKQFVVFMPFDSSALTPEAQAVTQEAAAYARLGGATSVQIVGHADSSGSPQYNLALSERRATAVADALADAGLSPATLSTDGKGETELAVPTPDGVKEPLNRRVTIQINF